MRRPFVVALVALAACARPAPRPLLPPVNPLPSSPTADVPPTFSDVTAAVTDTPAASLDVRAERSLRSVDWCNVYLPIPEVALHDCRGHFLESHRQGEGPHTVDEFMLTSVAYGDVTGDGREDALVLIGGTTRPLLLSLGEPRPMGWVMLFTALEGGVTRLAGVATGDAPAVRAMIRGGVTTVVRRRAGRDCAERWRWVTGELREDPSGGVCR